MDFLFQEQSSFQTGTTSIATGGEKKSSEINATHNINEDCQLNQPCSYISRSSPPCRIKQSKFLLIGGERFDCLIAASQAADKHIGAEPVGRSGNPADNILHVQSNGKKKYPQVEAGREKKKWDEMHLNSAAETWQFKWPQQHATQHNICCLSQQQLHQQEIYSCLSHTCHSPISCRRSAASRAFSSALITGLGRRTVERRNDIVWHINIRVKTQTWVWPIFCLDVTSMHYAVSHPPLAQPPKVAAWHP